MAALEFGWLRTKGFWCALELSAALAALVVNWSLGAKWGLPSPQRNRLYYRSGLIRADAPRLTAGHTAWDEYPNTTADARRTGRYAPSAFNPLRSYHPDEYNVLKSLRDIGTMKHGLFPGFYAWPPLYFYEVGAALVAARAIGYVRLSTDPLFYYRNPQQLARMYVVGRLVTLILALVAIVALWSLAGRLYGSAAATAAAFFLVCCPMFSYNAGFMTTDVPMLAWTILAALFAARAMQDGRTLWYALAGVCVGLAAATRYYGALAGLAVIAAHALSQTDARRPILKRVFSGRLWLAGLAAIAVFLLLDPFILRPGLLSAVASGHVFTYPYIFDPRFLSEMAAEARGSQWATVGRIEAFEMFLRSGLGLPLTIMALSGLCFMLIRNVFVARYREDFFLLISFLPVATGLLAGRPAMLRYLMPALPLAIMAAALVASELVIAWPTRKNRFLLGAGVCAVALVALLAWAHSTSLARLRLAPDTRTRAGIDISRRIPAGATIGVLENPWQFYEPPMDLRRNEIVVTGMDPAKLRELAPDWFVHCDTQFPPTARRESLTDAEREFLRILREKYRVVKEFHRWPKFLGLRFAGRAAPHDMRYCNPQVFIYQRADRPAPGK